jgi:hypothetical protein
MARVNTCILIIHRRTNLYALLSEVHVKYSTIVKVLFFLVIQIPASEYSEEE